MPFSTMILLLLALQAQPPRPLIRSSVIYVETTVVVHDERGRFVGDLGKADFEIYEDGVRQEAATFALTRGGRVVKTIDAPAAPAPEGMLLPPTPRDESTGRIYLIVIDDFHLDARQTPLVRDLLKKVGAELIHDGDLFGVVSTGTSSIAVDMTYDRRQLTRAIQKVMGGGLTPGEIIGTPSGAHGPPEVRHRVHVAFSTAYEILQKFERIHNRRKAMVLVSNGYDFDPFSKSRAKTSMEHDAAPGADPFGRTGNEFAAADLAAELSELTRQANRANTTIYTIDPRGLTAGPDLDQTGLDISDWQDHIRETQNSLRVIADQTGGIAVVNTNNFTAALRRIDAVTGDNYVLGYYTSNSDQSRKVRGIEVRVRPGDPRAQKYQLTYKTSYTLKPGAGN